MATYFGEGRIGSFRDVARSYLERVTFQTDNPNIHFRANKIVLDLLNDLRSGERARLIFRFSNLVAVLADAGANFLYLVLEPPGTPQAALKVLKQHVPADWIEKDGTVRNPSAPDTFFYIADLPKLSCFGFMLIELFAVSLIETMKQRDGVSNSAAHAKQLNQMINREIASMQQEKGYSDHTHRKFSLVVRVMESACEDGFDCHALQDQHVLQGWELYSSEEAPTRFTEWLKILAELTASVDETSTVQPLEFALDMHDEKVSYQLDEDLSLAQGSQTDEDSVSLALADPIVAALLGRDGGWSSHYLLMDLRNLRAVHLSRMRALTFRSAENKLIQAKRDKSGLSANGIYEDLTASDHGETLVVQSSLCNELASLLKAQFYLLWSDGDRKDAMTLLVSYGLLTADDLQSLSGATDFLSEGAEPPELIAGFLKQGNEAWSRLKRRNAFKPLSGVSPSEHLDIAVHYSGQLMQRLERELSKLKVSVMNCRSGPQFSSEVAHFQKTLLTVHQLSFG